MSLENNQFRSYYLNLYLHLFKLSKYLRQICISIQSSWRNVSKADLILIIIIIIITIIMIIIIVIIIIIIIIVIVIIIIIIITIIHSNNNNNNNNTTIELVYFNAILLKYHSTIFSTL